MGSKIILLLFIFFLIPLVSSQEVPLPEFSIRQNTNADLSFTCNDEFTGDACDTTYTCNVSYILFPNNSAFVNNSATIKDGNLYSLNIPDTTQIGFHQYQTICSNESNGAFSPTLYYLVNPTGQQLTTPQAILYLFALILGLVIFILSLFGAIKIPWKNQKNDEGWVVKINDLKYVKLFLWFASYISIIFLTFLAWNITDGFLWFNVASRFFQAGFWILASFMFPIIVILFITSVVNFVEDKKNKEKLKRGFQF